MSPFLDPGRQFDFLLRRQQLDLADLAQVKLDGRVAVISRALPAPERVSFRFGLGFGGKLLFGFGCLERRLFLGQVLFLGLFLFFLGLLLVFGGLLLLRRDLLGQRRRRHHRAEADAP